MSTTGIYERVWLSVFYKEESKGAGIEEANKAAVRAAIDAVRGFYEAMESVCPECGGPKHENDENKGGK